MTIGKKIRFRRELLGYSQQELADKAHIGRSYISELENDKYQPTAPVIVGLAKALKCTADYLIEDSEKEAV